MNARTRAVALCVSLFGCGGGRPEPSPAGALAAEGRKLVAKGDEREGAAKLDEAARLAPDDAAIALDACKAWVAADDAPRAIKSCRTAAKLVADDPEVHHLVGVNAHRLERRDEALVALRRALELDPALAKAHHELAMVLLEGAPSADDLDLAVAEAREAVRLAPGEVAFEIGLARALTEAKACEAATETIIAIGDRGDVAPLRARHFQLCGG